jgi:hypothetical protein
VRADARHFLRSLHIEKCVRVVHQVLIKILVEVLGPTRRGWLAAP